MSHDEIWDDSALIASWDQAVDEYKKYHSIAAKGDVEEAIRLYETTQSQSHHAGAGSEPEPEPEPAVKTETIAPATASPAASAAAPSPMLPETLISKSDQAIKNLMMSWYYAGYYTGRLEGRQEALAEMETQTKA